MAQRTSLEAKLSTDEKDPDELTPSERRTYRARNERMLVVPQVGADGNATGLYNVYSASGKQYLVDVFGDNRCTCPDQKHHRPEDGCKHLKRVRIMLDATALPDVGERVAPFFDDALAETASELRVERESLDERKRTVSYFLDGLRSGFEEVERVENVFGSV